MTCANINAPIPPGAIVCDLGEKIQQAHVANFDPGYKIWVVSGSGSTDTTHSTGSGKWKDIAVIKGKEWIQKKKESISPYMLESIYKTFGDGGLWIGKAVFNFERDSLKADQLEPTGFKPLDFPDDLFLKPAT